MTAREVALRVLTEAESGEAFVDNALAAEASKHRLTERDRRFVQELTYGVTRLRKRLDYVIDQYCRRRITRSRLRNVLRMGAYQILSMDVPDYAAVDESVKLLGGQDRKLIAFVNAVLRRIAVNGKTLGFPDPGEEPVRYLATYYSHPEWLVRRWMDHFGYEETKRLCQLDNEVPSLSLRVNRTRASVEDVVRLLRHQGIECTPGQYLDYVLRVDGSIPLTELRPFTEGLIQVQDESAALVGELAEPEREEIVVDLCASPGGKTTHIAELMGDGGLVIAVDVSVTRLRPLLENLVRLRLKSVTPVVSDSRYFRTRRADLVLLDVPCSGTGTIRRRPDLRWRRVEGDLEVLRRLQMALLANAADMLNSGGRLVYSTCSIEPEENEEVVAEFLRGRQDFTLEKPPTWVPRELVRAEHYVATLPHIHGIDGMFASVLVKRGRHG